MLVFGIDIPLVEIVLLLSIIIFILFIEVIVILVIQVRHLRKIQELKEYMEKISGHISEAKTKELHKESIPKTENSPKSKK